jgi:hypothetical protein
MTFAKRQINIIFSIDGKEIYLDGLRSQAIISNPGGNNGAALLQLKVYGMTLAQMNSLSSTGSSTKSGALALNNISITLLAGDEGQTVGQIFSGGVQKSYIDFSAAPEVSFVVSARSGLWEQANPVSANSWAGTQNAEDLIASLVKQLGEPWSFKNNGAHAIVQNQNVYGSIISQIQKIAKYACFPLSIDGNVVSIWANNGVRDDMVIDVSAKNGLVGYPSFNDVGFTIKTEFNPNMINGRTINLTSVIPKANGKAPIQSSTHEISTLTPDGAWFTTVVLSASGYVPVN